MMRRIRIGIRPSALAYRQAQEAGPYLKRLFPRAIFEIIKIRTTGDLDKKSPLEDLEGSDFFTRQIDEALLRKDIDAAVHSAKDLADIMPSGLKIALETPTVSAWDALVSRTGQKLFELPPGSRVGTSSRRRKEDVRRLRPDLQIVDVRGTIEERLGLIKEDKIDALIVAHAALLRLGLEDRATQIFPEKEFFPHPKQGRLSIVVRAE